MSTEFTKIGYGTTVSIGGTLIGEMMSISGPNVTADAIDVTTMSSTGGYREFIQGLKDGGELSIELKKHPGDAGQAAVYTSLNAGTADTIILTFPTSMATTWTFTGITTGFEDDIPLDDGIGMSITFKVSGKPVLGTTLATGWSAFSLRDSGDSADVTNWSITPAVAAGEYFYTATFDTDTSGYPKVTAASHTIKLYVDDVYVEELTTATVGSAIAFSAGETKKLTIIAYEDNTMPRTYQVMCTRTS